MAVEGDASGVCPGSPPPVEIVIDREQLTNNTFGDTSLMLEVVGLFLDQLVQSRQRMTSAADETEWHFLTHTLKGAAASIGAVALTKLARELEAQGLPRNAEARQQALSRFDAAHAAFRAASQGLAS